MEPLISPHMVFIISILDKIHSMSILCIVFSLIACVISIWAYFENRTGDRKTHRGGRELDDYFIGEFERLENAIDNFERTAKESVLDDTDSWIQEVKYKCISVRDAMDDIIRATCIYNNTMSKCQTIRNWVVSSFAVLIVSSFICIFVPNAESSYAILLSSQINKDSTIQQYRVHKELIEELKNLTIRKKD